MSTLANYDFNAHIHLFQWNEMNILLDVNSGAIHVLDDMACDFIKNLIASQGSFALAREKTSLIYPEDQVAELEDEIKRAWEDGSLFSEEEIINLNLTQMPVKALCLNVAHACNMKCKYCFASQGDFGGKPSLMSLETGQKSLDFLVQKSAGIKNLEVDFFGGEPLLNFEMVKSLVSYGRELEKSNGKHFNFTLTTNALLLNQDIMDFLIEEDISIILSLDGRPETNDNHRILNDGSGSYDTIVPNIKAMVNKNPSSYYVRGTFTRKNLDFASDLKHIIDLGIDALSLEPAVGPDNPFSIREEDLPAVLSEYERLTDILQDYYLKGQDIHFFHYNLNLQKGPCIAKRLTGCGAGFEYLVVTPDGEIYPCHQFVGNEEFLMGNVDDGELNKDIINLFANNHLRNKEECIQCWARYFCGGGCHANNLKRNGDIKKPDEVSCIMHKKRIEGAIYLDLIKKAQKQDEKIC